MSYLPSGVAELVSELSQLPGAVAVALGGSRAMDDGDATSDWDLALYYRGALELAPLARYGPVHPPGTWGRIMNGGAWLTIGGAKVDVLLRDLDVVERFAAAARRGEYELDALLGYLAGIPTYSLLAELALGRLLTGALPAAGDFPAALAETATRRWRFHVPFSLEQARMRAARGDVVGTVGQAAKAMIEAGHAILCARKEWVLNEKRILLRAGLGALNRAFSQVPTGAPALLSWLEAVRSELDAALGH